MRGSLSPATRAKPTALTQMGLAAPRQKATEDEQRKQREGNEKKDPEPNAAFHGPLQKSNGHIVVQPPESSHGLTVDGSSIGGSAFRNPQLGEHS
jgi:hypothetical protein